jgi:AcrR family transcriptional regulator
MTISERPQHRRLGVEARREQLLRLGLELFGAASYDELSIDDIARAAGVSKGLLYHYFPSKRDFYVAALRVAADELLAETQTAPSDDPIAELSDTLDRYFDYVERHAVAYVALFRGGIGCDAEVREIVESTRRGFLERLLSRVDFGASSAAARNAFRGYIGFVEAAVLDWVERREVDRERLRKLCIRIAQATASALV